MNKAIEIAEYVLKKIPMSNLRLQKILYFIQGESYKLFNYPAFNDAIAAWKHGPVVPNVYLKFCAYGGSPISSSNTILLEDNVREAADNVLSRYKDEYVWDLVSETHKEGTPWDEIYYKFGDKAIIPENLIKSYFTGANLE